MSLNKSKKVIAIAASLLIVTNQSVSADANEVALFAGKNSLAAPCQTDN